MNAPTRILVAVIQFYRTYVSSWRPPACRYTPSCSAYAVEALQRFGVRRGAWLAFRRLLRCHPFLPGGHDPVPLTVGRTARGVPVGQPLPAPESASGASMNQSCVDSEHHVVV